ncbi:MAG: prevent-host-death protein [Gammaproteobacteria bacterium]|nr:prevent-host-death protein [Gammaproteobacteria bacterium]MYF28040.1 prevent-host-death protein [Gammaproteobacteria bacterium]MYK47179.1 prevent-host-death protein [Gammaproteobacteria bacterium]
MDTVIEDRVAVVITRKTSEPVVMMAKSEHDSMMETYHLLRSPLNAERLRQAIAEVEAGEVVTATLSDGSIEEKR